MTKPSYAFEVVAELTGLDKDTVDQFVDWMIDTVEAKQLGMFGTTKPSEMHVFISRLHGEGDDVTEDDIKYIQESLLGSSYVTKVIVGPLFDEDELPPDLDRGSGAD